MADVKKIATRDSYGNTLKELAAEGHEDLVVLDADLAAATKTGMFRKAYPDRHFDCGIAEGNMVGVAAGLAAMGYVPFVSSFAMFAAGRAFEQVRNSVGYPHLNVKIGATFVASVLKKYACWDKRQAAARPCPASCRNDGQKYNKPFCPCQAGQDVCKIDKNRSVRKKISPGLYILLEEA